MRRDNVAPSLVDEVQAVCAGKFAEYGEARALQLVKRLVALYEERKIRLTLIGAAPTANAGVRKYIENNYPQITVCLMGRVSRHRLLRKVYASDVGLLLVRDDEFEYGTKIYDYILCGITILTNASEGSDLGNLVEENSLGNIEINRSVLIAQYRKEILGKLAW